MRSLSSNRQAGFTLIEVAVVAPIMILMLAVFLNFLITLYTSTIEQNGVAELVADNDQTLSTIRNDLYLTNGFRTVIDSNLTDTDAPSGGWSYKTNPISANVYNANYQTLIAGTLGTTKVIQDPTRDIVYLNQYGCDVPSLNPPMINNYIYTVKQSGYEADGTTRVYGLYRRVLVDPASTCGSAIQQQTCTTGTASCPADTLLVTGVSKFIIFYYAANSAPGTGTVLDVYNTPSLMPSAAVAYITLGLKRTYAGDTNSYSWIIYVKKLNS
jgi:hypothetical protein